MVKFIKKSWGRGSTTGGGLFHRIMLTTGLISLALIFSLFLYHLCTSLTFAVVMIGFTLFAGLIYLLVEAMNG